MPGRQEMIPQIAHHLTNPWQVGKRRHDAKAGMI